MRWVPPLPDSCLRRWVAWHGAGAVAPRAAPRPRSPASWTSRARRAVVVVVGGDGRPGAAFAEAVVSRIGLQLYIAAAPYAQLAASWPPRQPFRALPRRPS